MTVEKVRFHTFIIACGALFLRRVCHKNAKIFDGFSDKKRPLRKGAVLFVFVRASDIDETTDAAVHDHEDQIEDPDEPAAEDTDDTRNDLAFGKSRDQTADPCRERNDRKDDADDSAETEVIFLCCHF